MEDGGWGEEGQAIQRLFDSIASSTIWALLLHYKCKAQPPSSNYNTGCLQQSWQGQYPLEWWLVILCIFSLILFQTHTHARIHTDEGSHIITICAWDTRWGPAHLRQYKTSHLQLPHISMFSPAAHRVTHSQYSQWRQFWLIQYLEPQLLPPPGAVRRAARTAMKNNGNTVAFNVAAH